MTAFNDKELLDLVDRVIANFKGDVTELKNAIGVLFVFQRFGWKPAMLMFSPQSVRKYEHFLGIRFRDRSPEAGPQAGRSQAWCNFQPAGNLWKAIKGEVPGIRTPQINRADENWNLLHKRLIDTNMYKKQSVKNAKLENL